MPCGVWRIRGAERGACVVAGSCWASTATIWATTTRGRRSSTTCASSKSWRSCATSASCCCGTSSTSSSASGQPAGPAVTQAPLRWPPCVASACLMPSRIAAYTSRQYAVSLLQGQGVSTAYPPNPSQPCPPVKHIQPACCSSHTSMHPTAPAPPQTAPQPRSTVNTLHSPEVTQVSAVAPVHRLKAGTRFDVLPRCIAAF